jgi:hypothetical protein
MNKLVKAFHLIDNWAIPAILQATAEEQDRSFAEQTFGHDAHTVRKAPIRLREGGWPKPAGRPAPTVHRNGTSEHRKPGIPELECTDEPQV